MIPYGRRPKLRQNLVDNHIPKHDNWWEVECNSITKKRERQQAKKELLESFNEPQDLIFTRKEMGRHDI